MTDRGEPGVNDEIGITLTNSSNTLLHSSNWVSGVTEELYLIGGNIVVHSGFNVQSDEATEDPNEPGPLPGQEESVDAITLSAIPNPFKMETSVTFKVPMETTARVEIYTLSGTPVETLFEGPAEANREYSLKFSGYNHLFTETYVCVIRTDYGTKFIRIIRSR
jgi:hypothetical protein